MALGAYLRYKITLSNQENDYGVDVQFWNLVERDGQIQGLSSVLHLKLKCIDDYRIDDGEIVYQIENKTLNDIIIRNINQTTPLIVVLLHLPKEPPIDWMNINHNNIRFMKSL